MNSFNRVTCDWHGRTKSNIAAMEGTVKIFFKRDIFMHSMCTLVNCNFQRFTSYFLLLIKYCAPGIEPLYISTVRAPALTALS